MKGNIEDIFGKAFGQFEETPSERVWQAVKHDREEKLRLGLTETTAESEASHGLGALETEPGEGVWEAIAHNRFMKLVQRRLVRAAAVLLLLVSTTLVYINSRQSPDVDKTTPTKPIAGQHSASSANKPEANKVTGHLPKDAPAITKGQTQERSPAAGKSSAAFQIQNENAGTSNSATAKPDETAANAGNVIVEKVEAVLMLMKNLPQAKANLEKLPRPNWLQSPHGDHFVYFATNKNKRGSNYTKYTSQTDLNNEPARLKVGFNVGFEMPRYFVNGDSTYYNRLRSVTYEGRSKGYSANLTARLKLWKGFFVQSGLGIVRRSASPNYQAKFSHQVMVIGGPGNTTFVNVIDLQISAQTAYHLTHLEVPVLIGHSFGERRTTYNLSAGLLYHQMAGKGGYLLSAQSMKVTSVNNAAEHPFANRGWGAAANLGLAVQLKHEWSLAGDACLKWYRQNMYSSPYPANQTMLSVGGNVGIRYHID